jgi:uncharacterized RDD family membrane protein YckC
VNRCPNCDRPIEEREKVCPHCGAKQLPRRVIFGNRSEEFTLTAEEQPERGEELDRENWRFPSDLGARADRTSEEAFAKREGVRWGGFFRRLLAFVIDMFIIVVLAAFMFLLSYIGYTVGLAGYGRAITWRNAAPLFVFTTWGGMVLATLYFVVFHGMEGKTIGKWLLGLRVVGADQTAIGYRQALLRWLAEVVFAPLVVGFLWVLWSHEKKAWHDYLAHTWVIRD